MSDDRGPALRVSGPVFFTTAVSLLFLLLAQLIAAGPAAAASVESYFNSVKDQPAQLREFLYHFPKGGELHTHLDGAVYAENYIAWAAADGKCIDLASYTVTMPPCVAAAQRPALADVQWDANTVNRIVDAFSMRNYERGPLSGHDQFFATFGRYALASRGRQGYMLAEVASRAARQNTLYLEIMQSYGMSEARRLEFTGETALRELAQLPALDSVTRNTLRYTDRAEQQWREVLDCAAEPGNAGCGIEVRYLAQVIRTFPPAQVLAQTLLAFKLMAADSRYVGLNFVAPEDAPITLRDHTKQMEIIRDVAALFPQLQGRISLHAGELALPLVPPEAMRSHIHEAVHIAGARRIGHGVDIVHEDNSRELREYMARQDILVEINLTSNAVILGVEGDEHPFDLYRMAGVPLALSTDDEGVSRIDLTHEYVRATRSYDLSYAYLMELSRNSLAYSFLPGESLFEDISAARMVAACRRDRPGRALSDACRAFVENSDKARLQWQLEERLRDFAERYD